MHHHDQSILFSCKTFLQLVSNQFFFNPSFFNTYYIFYFDQKNFLLLYFQNSIAYFSKIHKITSFSFYWLFFHSFSRSICESMKNTLQSTFFNFSSKSKLIYFFKSNLFKGDYCLYTFFQFIFYCNHLYFIVTIKGIYIGT